MTMNQREQLAAKALVRNSKILHGEIKMYQEAAERHKQEMAVMATRDRDRLATIAQKDEQLRFANEKVSLVTAERDRIMRLVDQFTSISISGPSLETRMLRKP